MPTEYEILPARLEHAAVLPELEQAAARLFPPEYLTPEDRHETTPVAELEAASREGRLWVAIDSAGAPVGFALADTLDEVAHLAELDVHPDHGQRGLGRALVARVVAWARSRGYEAVSLTTFRHLPFNAPFYQSAGFRILGPEEITQGLAEVLEEEEAQGLSKRVAMRLDLGPAGTGA
jgi:GNAT superfamily N-acetyltransferase